MVVDRSERRCLLCEAAFRGRAFLCRDCATRYGRHDIPISVRQRFYEAIDRAYPDWSNTFGHYNPPVALLARIAALARGSRILEIGAGGGFTVEQLSDLGFDRLSAVDLTASTMQAIRGRVPDASLATADAERLPFADGCFDVVLSSDLIEHLPDLHRHLSEVARILKPGGRYFIKTPNRRAAEAYYWARGLYDWRFWHPSMQSARELGDILWQHGFESRFLRPRHLTDAQLRKIPIPWLRSIGRQLPLRWLPPFMQIHFEVEAPRVDR